MIYLLLGLAVAFIPFVMPIAGWVSARRNRRRVIALEALMERQALEIAALERRLARVEQGREESSTATAIVRAPAVPEADVRPAPAVEPEPPANAHEVLTEREAAADVPDTVASPEDTPPPALAAFAPSAEAAGLPSPAVPRPSVDWESLIGVKLFSAIAGIALVIAAILFLRYSIEQGWMQPPVRVAIGVLVSILLLGLCELKAAREYPSTANALDGAAIAILFATFFAAHVLWGLIPSFVAFAMLAAVTALAVLLSIRRESLFIAVLGLLGGFATPILLSTGENQPVPLFAYLLLLNVGLAWVAYRQVWPALTWMTLALTTVYQWGWVIRFLDASSIPLAMAIFLIFPIVSIAGLLLRRGEPTHRGFQRTALLSAALPLLFATYLPTIPAYGAHAGLLFGFLLLVDAGLLAIAIARREELLHAAGALTTVVVVATWLARSYSAGGPWQLALGFTAAFVLFFLFAPAVAHRFGRPFSGAGAAARITAPVLLIVVPVLAGLEPAWSSPALPFGVLLALLLTIAWRAITTRDGPMYFVSAFFAVAAQASWSFFHLTERTLRAAVVMYAVFGVVALAVPLRARRRGAPLKPAWGGGVVLLASLVLLLFLSAGSVSASALWALALLLAILDAGLFVESAAGGLHVISAIGSVISYGVLAVWWSQAAATVGIVPSITVLTGLTLVTLAGHVWAHRQQAGNAAAEERAGSANTIYLGLLGHLFLIMLAANRAWSVPPWPLFASLAVMTVAASGASRLIGTAGLHAAGVAAAAFVVSTWAGVAGRPTWGTVAVFAGASVSAYALAWVRPVRPQASRVAARAAAVVLFLGELTLLSAVAGSARPPHALEVAGHVANIAALLLLTAAQRWSYVAIGAVLPAWMAVLPWQVGVGRTHEWTHLIVLAGSLYALFVVYPLALGRRACDSRDPYIAAILASGMFFFAARAAFADAGLSSVVGAIPVLEGAVLAALVKQLVGLQPAGARDTGRLALTAGAALAFATVAIPLQLEHQWITVGWALEGCALAWLYRRVPHRGLLYTAVVLLACVFVRLSVNPEVLLYEARGSMRVFNWYLYTYLIAAGASFAAARWFRGTADQIVSGLPRASQLLPGAGVVLLFLLLNIEIADFYSTGPTITFRFGATLSQDLTYTIGWLAFGMLLLAAGIVGRSRPARATAVGLIAVTTFKCFLYDLGSLEGLYRVASFVGLALSLALVAIALQRYVLRAKH